MFGFIQTRQSTQDTWLKRMRSHLQPQHGIMHERRMLFGRPSLLFALETHQGQNEKILARRSAKIEQMLAQHQITRIAHCGERAALTVDVPPVSAQYLHRYFAGEIGALAAEKTGGTVYCIFRGFGPLEERAVLKLAAHYRYFILEAGRDTEQIAKALTAKYGIPTRTNPSASQVEQADFVLSFVPHETQQYMRANCLHFAPHQAVGTAHYGKTTAVDFQIPEEFSSEIPSGFAVEPVVSEAARCGLISLEKMKIHRIRIDNAGESGYNVAHADVG